MSGYFDRLGTRVAAMTGPSLPTPRMERLILDPPPEAVPAVSPATPPEMPPAAQTQAPRPDLPQLDQITPTLAPPSEVPQALDPQPASDTAPAEQPLPPVSDRTSQTDPFEEALQPPLHTHLDPVEAWELSPTPALPETPQPGQMLVPPTPDAPTSELAPERDPSMPSAPAEDATPEEMSPQEHLAIFEQFIDKLNGRDVDPAPPEPDPPADIQPSSPAPQPQAPPADPTPQRPALEIGEINVAVQAPTTAHQAAASQLRRSPPRAMPSRRGMRGLRPM